MAPLHCYKRTNTHPDCGEAFAYEEEFSPSLIGDVFVPHKIYVKTEESAVRMHFLIGTQLYLISLKQSSRFFTAQDFQLLHALP